MKKILLVAVAVALAACGGAKDDYRNALPKDAVVVAGFNMKSVGDKMNASDFSGSDLALLLREVNVHNFRAEIGASNGDMIEFVAALLDPENSGGLSTADDIYFFAGGDANGSGEVLDLRNAGVLAKVADRKKIEEVAAKVGMEHSVSETKSVAGQMGDQTAVAVWNDKVFLFYAANKPYAEIEPKLEAMLAQKKADGLMGVKSAADVLTARNDFCAVLSYGRLFDMISKMPMADMSALSMMPASYMDMIKGTRYAFTGNFEKGRMVVNAQMYHDTKESAEAFKEYLDMSGKMVGKIKGDVLKYIPENAMMAFAGNLDWSALYDYMITLSPDTKKLFEQVPPVKAVMSAIGGDMAIALTGMDVAAKMPTFTFVTELKQPDVILGYAAMASAMGAKTVGENQFLFSYGSLNIHFGVQGNMFYATNDASTVAALAGEEIASMDGLYPEVFNSWGGVVMNIAAGGTLLRSLDGELRSEGVNIGPDVMSIVDMFATVEMSAPELTKAHIVLTMTDKEMNAAEVFYRAAQKVAKLCLDAMPDEAPEAPVEEIDAEVIEVVAE
jgi:hypothetical protein